MCKKFPDARFVWANKLNKYTSDFIKNYNENNDLGYIIEVDIKYPKHLKELHRD